MLIECVVPVRFFSTLQLPVRALRQASTPLLHHCHTPGALTRLFSTLGKDGSPKKGRGETTDPVKYSIESIGYYFEAHAGESYELREMYCVKSSFAQEFKTIFAYGGCNYL